MNYDLKYLKEWFYWGMSPNSLVVDLVQYLDIDAKILDLGCWEGRDSLFLAKHGFQVTAVDCSEIWTQKLTKLAQKENVMMEIVASDASSYLVHCNQFDVVIAMNVLQFIDQEDVLQTIKQIQECTNDNWLNVISSFIAENVKQKNVVVSKGKYFFDEWELQEIYKDWNILFYEEKLGDRETHGELPHRHFTVKLIAQKK